ncbi:trypsin-like peptidase domain-containing protein [Streptomyces sp. NPDC020875]|uniref:nSTAND1 domain-containing NTPase n=1 Tax=Streptomyces sp. NPDC020875 TaxID=3154898 RepID=UPI0034026A6E
MTYPVQPSGPEPEHDTGADGPQALDRAILRILDARRQPVGVGFLVSETIALTCAHVVSAALGTPAGTPPEAGAPIPADLPLVPGAPRTEATVELWVPPSGPAGAGDASPGADVAVLRFAAPPPGAAPVRLVDADPATADGGEPAGAADGWWGHRVRAFGIPAGRPGGVWHAGVLRGRQADGWVQADLAGDGYPVSRGFSGGPVWDDRLSGVVGMVTVAEAGEPAVGYLIPTGGLAAAWPELTPLVRPPSPFRGLKAYQEADAPVFHGRAAESDEITRALAERFRVTVVGPSGSGKSSLALAGVAPRLRADGARVAVMRPAAGTGPLAALAAALLPHLEPDASETRRLARIPELRDELRDHGLAPVTERLLAAPGADRLLIVVDQLEELFQRPPDAVRELADVLFAAEEPPPGVRVLSTLRADFLERVLSHPDLGPVTGRCLHALGPLGERGLREIVTTPVDTAPGIRYEPHLAARVLADTGTDPGALPLLALTLDLLWRRQEDGRLTHRAYDALGGVTGALGNHADRVWAEHVPAEDEPAARRLFTHLVRLPPGAVSATRRLARRDDLEPDQWRVAQRLAAHTRLLVTDRGADGTETVELTHEALIHGWDRFAGWAAEDRAFLEWRETVRHEMDRWQAAGRATAHLPTAAALAGADTWLPGRAAALSRAEREYLDTGRTHRRARARRRGALYTALAAALAFIVVVGALYAVERRGSRERAALGASRALVQAAQEYTATDPARAALLALAAHDTAPTRETGNELLRQRLRYTYYDRVLSGDLADEGVATSRDGDVVLAPGARSGATLFLRALTGPVRTVPIPAPDEIRDVVVAPDGSRAAYVQEDGLAAWFDIRPGADDPVGPVHRLPRPPAPAEDRGDVFQPVISPDGTVLAVRAAERVVWWNLANGPHGTLAGNVPAPGTPFNLRSAADHRTLLFAAFTTRAEKNDERLLALDLATGRTRLVARADEIEVSGDRTRAVLCRTRGKTAELTVHRVADGTREGGVYRAGEKDGVPGGCPVKAVDGSGFRVALGAEHGLTVVDLRDGTVLSRNGLADPSVPTWAGNSPWLVDSGAGLHYVRRDGPMIGFVRLRPGDWTLSVAQQRLTPDGAYTISVLADGSRIQRHHAKEISNRVLADAPRGAPRRVPDSGDPLAVDRTGRLVADREGVNVVAVRDTGTLRRIATVTTTAPVPTPAPPPSIGDLPVGGGAGGERPRYEFRFFFDRDGKLITVADTVVEQWDPRTGERLARFDAAAVRSRVGGAPDAVLLVNSYPATNRVTVVVQDRPGVQVVDTVSGRITETVPTGDDILAAQFEPGGRYFAILRRGSIFELWRRGTPPRKELGPLRSVAESNETPYVASFLEGGDRFLLAANNAVRVYRIGEPGHEAFYSFTDPGERSSSHTGHSFLGASVDGETVLHSGPKGIGGPVQLVPDLWFRELCDVIGDRELTRAEAELLPADPRTRRPCAGD